MYILKFFCFHIYRENVWSNLVCFFMHCVNMYVDLVQKSLACKLLSNISLNQRLALKNFFHSANTPVFIFVNSCASGINAKKHVLMTCD